MRELRLKIMLHLYGWSSKIYASTFKWKKDAWGISKEDFLKYSEDSLGYALGEFYRIKQFDVMPKLENHDVFHVLTEMGTEIEDEVAMQFLLLGNGKVSLYLLGMVVIGGFIFPEYIHYYIKSYKKGKSMQRFYDVEFNSYLDYPLAGLKASFHYSTTLINLKNI